MYYESKNDDAIKSKSEDENEINIETNTMEPEEQSKITDEIVPLKRDESEVCTETDDIAEITLTDFAETTDSDSELRLK